MPYLPLELTLLFDYRIENSKYLIS